MFDLLIYYVMSPTAKGFCLFVAPRLGRAEYGLWAIISLQKPFAISVTFALRAVEVVRPYDRVGVIAYTLRDVEGAVPYELGK